MDDLMFIASKWAELIVVVGGLVLLVYLFARSAAKR